MIYDLAPVSTPNWQMRDGQLHLVKAAHSFPANSCTNFVMWSTNLSFSAKSDCLESCTSTVLKHVKTCYSPCFIFILFIYSYIILNCFQYLPSHELWVPARNPPKRLRWARAAAQEIQPMHRLSLHRIDKKKERKLLVGSAMISHKEHPFSGKAYLGLPKITMNMYYARLQFSASILSNFN